MLYQNKDERILNTASKIVQRKVTLHIVKVMAITSMQEQAG